MTDVTYKSLLKSENFNYFSINNYNGYDRILYYFTIFNKKDLEKAITSLDITYDEVIQLSYDDFIKVTKKEFNYIQNFIYFSLFDLFCLQEDKITENSFNEFKYLKQNVLKSVVLSDFNINNDIYELDYTQTYQQYLDSKIISNIIK